MIHKIRRRNGFAQIANTALRDTRLSYCSRGMLAMVMSHSESWKTTTSWIRSQTSTEGQVAVANAIKQLQQFGYLLIQREKDGGGKVKGCVWTWTDEPDLLQDESPRSRILHDGSPVSETPPPSEDQLSEHQKEEELPDDSASEPVPDESMFSDERLPLKAIPPSPTPSSARPPSAPLAKPEPKLRKRDELHDALMEVCWGIAPGSPATKRQHSKAGVALSDIKKMAPNVTVEMIKTVGAKLREQWKGLEFTPLAIADWWAKTLPQISPTPSEPDPFDNKPEVTRYEVCDKFPVNPDQKKWLRILEEQRRLR